MRTLFFGNNWVAWQLVDWLKKYGEEIVGLVIHPSATRKYTDELIESSGVSAEQIFDGSRLREPEIVNAIRRLNPEIGASVYFGYILRPELLTSMRLGCVNLHPAMLPYNKGAYPNVWSIIEGTPAGVTLHYMDAGIDTGDIIAQERVAIEPVDTGETLYRKLEIASVELFKRNWPSLREGRTSRLPQSGEHGSFHRKVDLELIREIQPDQKYTARELIDIIRACTFPPHQGAFFVDDGRKVFLNLHLEYED